MFYVNQFLLEKKIGNSGALFADDGGGMDPEGIRKCMSLGYSSKKTDTTIGQCNSYDLCISCWLSLSIVICGIT